MAVRIGRTIRCTNDRCGVDLGVEVVVGDRQRFVKSGNLLIAWAGAHCYACGQPLRWSNGQPRLDRLQAAMAEMHQNIEAGLAAAEAEVAALVASARAQARSPGPPEAGAGSDEPAR